MLLRDAEDALRPGYHGNTVLWGRVVVEQPRRWRARPAEAESSEANGAGADSAGEIEIVEGAGVEAGDEEQHRRARAQRYPAGETDGAGADLLG